MPSSVSFSGGLQNFSLEEWLRWASEQRGFSSADGASPVSGAPSPSGLAASAGMATSPAGLETGLVNWPGLASAAPLPGGLPQPIVEVSNPLQGRQGTQDPSPPPSESSPSSAPSAPSSAAAMALAPSPGAAGVAGPAPTDDASRAFAPAGVAVPGDVPTGLAPTGVTPAHLPPSPAPAPDGWVVPLGFPDGLTSPPAGASSPRLSAPPRLQILVQWTPDASEADRAAALARMGCQRKELIHTATMKARGEGVLEVVQLPESAKAEEVLAAYQQTAQVRYAEVDRMVQPQVVSNDTNYTNGSLWGMYSSDSPTAVGPAGTTNAFGSQAEVAWNNGFTGSKSVYVGIIDEGFDYNHADLAANAWLNPYDAVDGIDNDGNGYIDDARGWDFFNNDNSVFDGAGDDHGTHVAGTIGAVGGNGSGVVGVNWNVSMISTKFLGDTGGYTSGAIQALDYLTDLKIRHGLNIVASNNSWGGGGYSQALQDAIVRAAKQNILFIAAAGNAASNNDTTANYPSNYSSTLSGGTAPPATYDSVVAVASITDTGALSSFSNYGSTTVDLGAPGSAITSTLPGNTYGSYSGTSMATPHVTGAVALYAASHPEATAEQIRAALLASTTPTASLAGKTVTGGRLNVAAFLGVPTPTVLTLAASQASVLEGQSGSTPFLFQITRSGATTGTTQVAWAVSGSGSTPADAADFAGGVLPSGSVSFAIGETSKTITVAVQGDTLQEGAEAFALTLTNPSDGATLSTATVTNTILNDDGVLIASNQAAIAIPTSGASTPFPSSVTVAGGSTVQVASVEVTLSNLTHTWADDLDILLVGPTGAKTLLMSDAGGSNPLNGVTLTFSAQAATALPDGTSLTTGSYRPMDFEVGDVFSSPAPAGPYTANLSVFNGTNPTGTWSLYVQDDATGDSGSLAGGWSLSITTAPISSTLAIQSTAGSQSLEGNSGSTPSTFLVSRSGDVSGSSSVAWAVAGSGTSPANGADFVGGTLPTGQLTFGPGETAKTIALAVAGDTTAEQTETFTVTLSSSTGGASIGTAAASGTIRNDDTALSLSAAQTVVEGQVSPQSVTYTVNLSFASALPVSVDYATADGTAVAGTDYTAVAGTLNFAPGATSASISVPILNDNLGEDDETFALNLFNPTNGVLTTATATTTLSDTLKASVTTTLPADVENLLLTGTSAISGTGNASANRLTGNTANNSLNGAAGADLLNGGAGGDTLSGGSEADTFVVRFGESRASAPDRITDFVIGTDKLAILTTTNAGMVPTSLTQAADSTTNKINTLVSNVFADADGATAGSQPLAINAASIVVVPSGSLSGTYLIVNDAAGGYQSTSDLVVNITGYTGPLAGSLMPSTWFV